MTMTSVGMRQVIFSEKVLLGNQNQFTPAFIIIENGFIKEVFPHPCEHLDPQSIHQVPSHCYIIPGIIDTNLVEQYPYQDDPTNRECRSETQFRQELNKLALQNGITARFNTQNCQHLSQTQRTLADTHHDNEGSQLTEQKMRTPQKIPPICDPLQINYASRTSKVDVKSQKFKIFSSPPSYDPSISYFINKEEIVSFISEALDPINIDKQAINQQFFNSNIMIKNISDKNINSPQTSLSRIGNECITQGDEEFLCFSYQSDRIETSNQSTNTSFKSNSNQQLLSNNYFFNMQNKNESQFNIPEIFVNSKELKSQKNGCITFFIHSSFQQGDNNLSLNSPFRLKPLTERMLSTEKFLNGGDALRAPFEKEYSDAYDEIQNLRLNQLEDFNQVRNLLQNIFKISQNNLINYTDHLIVKQQLREYDKHNFDDSDQLNMKFDSKLSIQNRNISSVFWYTNKSINQLDFGAEKKFFASQIYPTHEALIEVKKSFENIDIQKINQDSENNLLQKLITLKTSVQIDHLKQLGQIRKETNYSIVKFNPLDQNINEGQQDSVTENNERTQKLNDSLLTLDSILPREGMKVSTLVLPQSLGKESLDAQFTIGTKVIKRVDSFNYLDEKSHQHNFNQHPSEIPSAETPNKLTMDFRLPKLDLSSWSQRSSNSLQVGSITRFDADSVEIRPKNNNNMSESGDVPVLQVTNSMSLMERRQKAMRGSMNLDTSKNIGTSRNATFSQLANQNADYLTFLSSRPFFWEYFALQMYSKIFRTLFGSATDATTQQKIQKKPQQNTGQTTQIESISEGQQLDASLENDLQSSQSILKNQKQAISARKNYAKFVFQNLSSGLSLVRVFSLSRIYADVIEIASEVSWPFLFFDSSQIEQGDSRFKTEPALHNAENKQILQSCLFRSPNLIQMVGSYHVSVPERLKFFSNSGYSNATSATSFPGDFQRAVNGLFSLGGQLPALWTIAMNKVADSEDIVSQENALNKPASLSTSTPSQFRKEAAKTNDSKGDNSIELSGSDDLNLIEDKPAQDSLNASKALTPEQEQLLVRIVDVLSRNPAKICDLKDKGSIEVGKHADFIIFDPSERYKFSAKVAEEQSFPAELHILNSQQVIGRVVSTYLRGERVFHDGTFL